MQPTFASRFVDYSSLADQQLIRAALAGHQDAFSEIMYRYRDRLLNAIRNDSSCAESADDIVQDAFVRAFSALKSFRTESSFYTWLYRIALNSRRYYVRNRHRTMPLETLADHNGMNWIEPHPTPTDLVEALEECQQVRAALARLDDHHRAILVLREFEGCDYQAIAEALNVTLGTVRSRLSRARAQLRKELTQYWMPAATGPVYSDDAWTDRELSLTA